MWLHEEKQEGCISKYKYERSMCQSTKTQSHDSAQLHDDDEDVFARSVIDRYAARPLALENICLAKIAVMYDVIQSPTQTGETEDVNTEEDMHNTENAAFFDKDEIAKRIGCHWEEETAGNTMYKKVQSPYRTRKILSFKASPLLPMES